ncbi:hypothetical protein OHA21_38320 [Actinoplanes sp. NBC_00393]|uniref:hypothetical protein n=1 Tax=Actinoplanes sp. NBC_00393 TaxID=2975953 RepID=UPI002E245D9F
MTAPNRPRRAETGDTDRTAGALDTVAAILATAVAAIRAGSAEVIVVADLEQHDLDNLMLLGVWDDDTLRTFRQPWRIGTVAPVALCGEGEYLLLAHPKEPTLRRMRCRPHTRLLVRDATDEDPNPRSVWRADLDDAIRAYGDAREAGHGAADALGEVEHLLDQAEEPER